MGLIAPSTEQCATTAKTSEWENERVDKLGVQGLASVFSFLSHFSGEMGDPCRVGGAPGRCAPRHRKSPDHPKGT